MWLCVLELTQPMRRRSASRAKRFELLSLQCSAAQGNAVFQLGCSSCQEKYSAQSANQRSTRWTSACFKTVVQNAVVTVAWSLAIRREKSESPGIWVQGRQWKSGQNEHQIPLCFNNESIYFPVCYGARLCKWCIILCHDCPLWNRESLGSQSATVSHMLRLWEQNLC